MSKTKAEKLKEVELELVNRQLASKDFRSFIDYTFDDYVFGEWHEKLFDCLKRVEDGKLKRLIVELPPRVGKTELISKRFPAYLLGKNPKQRIIGASYGSDLASRNSREARRIIKSQEFSNTFPKFHLSDEKKEASDWETSLGGGYYSTGVGGALTGFGFDIGIIDDYCKNREDAESPTIREKTWDWYTSTFYTRKQGEHAAIIVLATRWHDDDLIGRLLKKEGGDEWEVVSFPALNDKDESFFPERFSSAYYQNERDNIGVRDFAALYQQDPILSMSNTFRKEDLRYFALSDVDDRKDEFDVGIFCDPAFSTRTSADQLVVIAQAHHRQSGEIYELDRIAGRYPPSEGKFLPINMAQKWKSAGWGVRFISVEDVSLNRSQQLFVGAVDEEMTKQALVLPLKRYVPKGKKEDRIRFKLEPVVSRNYYWCRIDDPTNKAWVKGEEEMLRFPTGDHDDIIDCMTQGVETWEVERMNGGTLSGKQRLEKLRANVRTMPAKSNNPYT